MKIYFHNIFYFQLFRHITIPSGGVVPHILSCLIPTTPKPPLNSSGKAAKQPAAPKITPAKNITKATKQITSTKKVKPQPKAKAATKKKVVSKKNAISKQAIADVKNRIKNQKGTTTAKAAVKRKAVTVKTTPKKTAKIKAEHSKGAKVLKNQISQTRHLVKS